MATGLDLRDLAAPLLYDLAYAELVVSTRRTKEEVEQLERLETVFRDAEFEDTTGMPALAQQYLPADQL